MCPQRGGGFREPLELSGARNENLHSSSHHLYLGAHTYRFRSIWFKRIFYISFHILHDLIASEDFSYSLRKLLSIL